MTFLAIQNELLPTGVGNTARFKETQRSSVKLWINDRYAEVWGLEDWTFRHGRATVSVTGGSQVVATPADFGIAKKLWLGTGTPLHYMAPDAFDDNYYGSTSTGSPEAWTITGGSLRVGPTPSASASDLLLRYEKKLTLLSADGDIPALPSEHHFMLVHGAEATGQVRMQDFTYQFSEQRFQNQLDAMRQNYLVDVRLPGRQWGRSRWG